EGSRPRTVRIQFHRLGQLLNRFIAAAGAEKCPAQTPSGGNGKRIELECMATLFVCFFDAAHPSEKLRVKRVAPRGLRIENQRTLELFLGRGPVPVVMIVKQSQ